MEDKLFKSIFKDYRLYRLVVSDILGKSSPFIEDIISDCMITIITNIRNGKIEVENIAINGCINKVYFKSIVRRRAIDWTRAKRNKVILTNDFPTVSVEPPEMDEIKTSCAYSDVQYINKKLITFEKQNSENKFHANVFRYYFFDGIAIHKISQSTNIPRSTLTKSKLIMQQNIIKWLDEKK